MEQKNDCKLCSINATLDKSELIQKVAGCCGMSQKDVGSCLNSIIETIQKELKNGGDIVIPGFGAFSVETRSARQARNFQTGKMMQIPATKTVKFKVGKTLKDAVK